VDRDAAAEAAAHDHDVVVLDANLVEESESVGEKRGFGRLARTSAVTPVVQQVDGVVGERSRKSGQIVGDIFRITPEVNESIRPTVRAHRDEHFSPIRRQRDRGCVAARRSRLRKVDHGTLVYEQDSAQREINQRYNGYEHEHGARKGSDV